MRLGNLDLHVVSDGTYWTDGAGLFGVMPRVEWETIVAPDEQNRVRLDLHCLLIDAGSQRILVDTGYGDKMPPKECRLIGLEGERRLLASLEQIGFGPEDVDLVINTHLHNDHCGGNTRLSPQGVAVPTFPRATVCVQNLELAAAEAPNERTRSVYRAEDRNPVEREGRLRVLDGDARLTPEVRVFLAPGHSPGHQCVVIESAGHTAAYVGDVSPWPIHLERLACVAAFDSQPLVSLETKRRVAHWAVENQVLLFFDHHPTILAGYLHATGWPDRFRLEPVEM